MNNKAFIEELELITKDNSSKAVFSVQDIQKILNTFDADSKPSDDTQKLTKIQQLYSILHNHFAVKAGNTDFALEGALDEGDFLFNKEAATH